MVPEFLARGGHQDLLEARDLVRTHSAVVQDLEGAFRSEEVGEGCCRGGILRFCVESGEKKVRNMYAFVLFLLFLFFFLSFLSSAESEHLGMNSREILWIHFPPLFPGGKGV